ALPKRAAAATSRKKKGISTIAKRMQTKSPGPARKWAKTSGGPAAVLAPLALPARAVATPPAKPAGPPLPLARGAEAAPAASAAPTRQAGRPRGTFEQLNLSLATRMPVITATTVSTGGVTNRRHGRFNLLREVARGSAAATEELLVTRWADEGPEPAIKAKGKTYQTSTFNSVKVMEIAQQCLLIKPEVGSTCVRYGGDFLALLGLGALVNNHAGVGGAYLPIVEKMSSGRIEFEPQDITITTPGSTSSKSRLFEKVFGIDSWAAFAASLQADLGRHIKPGVDVDDARAIIDSITDVHTQSFGCKTGQRMAAQPH
ncbi:unnamed protein product, partial [Prorocentrum cordatum]